jgi:hypothetical protein
MNTRDKQRAKTKSFPDATFKDLQWMEQVQQSPEQNAALQKLKDKVFWHWDEMSMGK